MAYQVIWSLEAMNSFDSIVEYLKISFSEKEVSRFVKLVNRRLLLMEKFPKAGKKVTKAFQRRKIVLHKRTTLYYRVFERNKEVRLLVFFDTRQNPRKLNR